MSERPDKNSSGQDESHKSESGSAPLTGTVTTSRSNIPSNGIINNEGRPGSSGSLEEPKLQTSPIIRCGCPPATLITMENLNTGQVLVMTRENELINPDPQPDPHKDMNTRGSSTELSPSNKIPFVSRILPISRKSSQVVPTNWFTTAYHRSNNNPGAGLGGAEAKDLEKGNVHVLEEINPTTSNCPGPQPGLVLEGSSGLKQSSEGSKPEAAEGVMVASLAEPNKDNLEVEAGEDVCRICHDNPSRMTLLTPCLCKGSMGKVHRVCLERWLGESAKTSCEICGHEYETERRPRYTGWRSFVAWIRNPLSPTDTRNLFFDVACFFILTPLAGISAWLCVVGAQHYSFGQTSLNPDRDNPDPTYSEVGNYDGKANAKKLRGAKNVEASNSTWTSIGLLTLTGTLLAAYYVWLFVAIRYHIQVWREWQSRNFIVTISPRNTETVQKMRKLREAAINEALGHHEQHDGPQQSPPARPEVPTSSEAARGPKKPASNNLTHSPMNNNPRESPNNNFLGGGSSLEYPGPMRNNRGNPPYGHQQQSEQQSLHNRESLTRVFDETSSMVSNGTLFNSTNPSSLGAAGPSHFRPASNNNADTDSLQGKVIYIIPSQSNSSVRRKP